MNWKKTIKNPFFWGSSFVVALIVAVLLNTQAKNSLVTLNREDLDQAMERWAEKGPADYQMEIDVSGVQQGRQSVVVRNHQVVEMKTGGEPVAKSAWEYWNVKGMFQFLDEEMAQAKNPQAGFGVSDPTKVYLSVEFNKEFGYPQQYLRQVFGQKKTIQWVVKDFAVGSGGDSSNSISEP